MQAVFSVGVFGTDPEVGTYVPGVSQRKFTGDRLLCMHGVCHPKTSVTPNSMIFGLTAGEYHL